MAQNGNNDLNEVLRQLAAVTQQLANRSERQSTDPAGDLFKKVSQRNRGQTTNQQNRVYYCKKCPYNHPGKDCEGKLVSCNKCHKLGHRGYECYSNDRTKGGPGGQPRGNFNGGQQRGFHGNSA
ncbi:putative 50 kDa protein in type I retrotransposable element R1DM, partial [Bienertia sinuspersici]